jgi:hypothetical protein
MEAVLEMMLSGIPMEEALAHLRMEADASRAGDEVDSPVSSCSFASVPSPTDVSSYMVADFIARIDPLDFEGFTLGRTDDELANGLIFMNLVEWRWVRRHLGSQPPPPVLVWLPPPGDNRPEWSGLREARDLTVRFPH